jgi:hypothetical protein
MSRNFNVGDIIRIKSEYHDFQIEKNIDTQGIVIEITRSFDHEYEGIRKLEEHTGQKIDIVKVMTSDGNISEWFDDEIDSVILETIEQK